ncbi:MAG: aminoacyl-tRNA hydrolase [Patescibacteria group bacterium]|nr:aminoacyl-tRNA hydrolase [Patescibacteria group bacterium]
MKIVIGLGNPLPKYLGTRHNLGQAVVSFFRQIKGLPNFGFKKKFASLIAQGKIDDEKIFLVLPQTFMNESGQAVKKIMENWSLKIENLIVVHDDLDLPLGKIRIRTSGSAGGHRGVQSIIDQLKTENFIRIKIGIKPSSKFKIQNLENFVLQRFSKEEKEIVERAIRKTCQVLENSLKEEVKNQTILLSNLPQ